jgi:hypothetical protein
MVERIVPVRKRNPVARFTQGPTGTLIVPVPDNCICRRSKRGPKPYVRQRDLPGTRGQLGPSVLLLISCRPWDDRTSRAFQIRPWLVSGGRFQRRRFFTTRGNNETRGAAAQECVTDLRVRHPAAAPRRIRRENAGPRWSCRQVKTGMTRSHRS